MQEQEIECASCECSAEEGKEEHGRTKFLIILGLALTIPIVILETLHDLTFTNYILLALATPVQFLLGKPFYARFFKAIKHRHSLTTDTLVVLSTSIAYLYSLVSTIMGQHVTFFEASSSVLTIFTIGEYLESRIRQTTSNAIKDLLALKPKTAIVIRNGVEETIEVDSIRVGDIVVVKPGEKVATDGIVVYGQSSIDESMITGESIPVDKKVDDKVVGGTINKNGYLRFEATSVGNHTVLASIIEMVEKARMSKASVQRIADRAVQYFIPIVLFIAMASSLFWFFTKTDLVMALTVFATVLVVACPCALGIATPMVVSIGIDKAARKGILIKGGKYLERLASVDTIVFDKTGTLTKGKPEVTDIIPNDGYDEFKVMQLASSAETKSEHPIARAIVIKASEMVISPLEFSKFSAMSGHGVVATYLEKRVFVVSPQDNNGHIPEKIKQKISELESGGKTVVTVYVDDELVGVIAVADALRENSKHVIDELKKMNKKVILMSGDNERTANAIAKSLGIENVLARALPERKSEEIKKIQNQGRTVAMVGDGINDAPALTQADVGIAIGSGTDIAMAAGHVVLMKSNLHDVIYALKIGKYSLTKIKQNLSISFVYNSVAISIAAGLLYGITNSLVLTPGLAALGWIISDSSVFGNSLLVKKFEFKHQV
ncbi:MAG: heavy metal translocating P-type ATPase [Nitrosotalea sp.]